MSIVEMCYQLRSTKVEAQSVINWTVVTHPFTVLFLCPRGETTFSKLGAQFLGLGYYCPSPEKIRKVFPVWRSLLPHHTPTKKLRKKLMDSSNFCRVRTAPLTAQWSRSCFALT